MNLAERKHALHAAIDRLEDPDALAAVEGLMQAWQDPTEAQRTELAARLNRLPEVELSDWPDVERQLRERLRRRSGPA